MDEREIIVVGAGPAGATAAMALARQGRDVLLLDRQDFPRDKICGDAVPAEAIQLLYDYGAGEKIEAAVERGEFYPVKKMFLASPRGYMIHAEFEETKVDSMITPRVYFDALLKEHAVDNGAEFCKAQVMGPIIEDGRVAGVNARFNGTTEAVRSKMVIAADGVSSVMSRALREDKHPPDHSAVAVRAYIEGLEIMPHEVEFYLYKSVLPGYAWIFPTKVDEANVGLGMRTDKFKETNSDLNRMMDEFLELPTIKPRLKPGWKMTGLKRWPLKFGSMKKVKRAYNNALLIGDAGAFINPLTGGGIHNSMITARIAAEVTTEALDSGDLSAQFLQQYETRCEEELWISMKRAHLMQRWLMNLPITIDVLIKLAGSNSGFANMFLSKL
jgi:geranylgeranyl reductase family protein